MGLYDQYEANPDLEANGIWLDYGTFRVRTRFTGGANKAYTKVLEATMKPFRRVIDQGALPEERSKSLLMGVYAKTIVADWETAEETMEDGTIKWKKGIETKDGTLIPVNPQNVLMTFQNLPNLFLDIVNAATSATNFRLANLEEDGKNS
jgi:hypothetical protein